MFFFIFMKNYKINIIEQIPDKTAVLSLFYGVVGSPFGKMVLAFDDTYHLYSLFFVNQKKEEAVIQELQQSFHRVVWTENQQGAVMMGNLIFPPAPAEENQLTLCLYGTSFQQCVWKALLQIPKGQTIAYSELAVLAGYPKAVRAVASAVARNRISLLIPCHRVIQKSGKIGQYRWGSDLKKLILAQER